MLNKILVGTDGSETAAYAVERAAQLAADTGAELLVFSAYSKDDGPDRAEVALEATANKQKKVKLRTLLREGDAAEAILDTAAEESVDLIVVGNKGMTGARRFLLGSVPNTVSHHAPCSVLIVRTT